ncbi:MAG: hypothetical protein HYR67_00830 [Bacteroidetes bacterium]|nr:hypothetical protein [Bacteroidota bacterium]
MKKTINYLFASVGVVAALIFGSCSKSDSLPAIDGYNSSNDVAKANLVAHWTFDDNNKEVISGTAPSNTYGTVASTTGQIGKALQLTGGALVYPSITAIGGANSLSNYTVSMWLNVKNNGNAFSTFFGIFPTGNTDFWGNLSLSAETGWFPATGPEGDTLVLKTNYLSLNPDNSTNGQDNRPDPRGKPPVGVFKSSAKWCHFVARFNASTHMLEIFGNGTSIGAYSNRGTNTTELVMRTPAQAVFGSLATSEIGFASAPARPSWQVLATASIDDVRVFNTALADKDITALYDLGKAAR